MKKTMFALILASILVVFATPIYADTKPFQPTAIMLVADASTNAVAPVAPTLTPAQVASVAADPANDDDYAGMFTDLVNLIKNGKAMGVLAVMIGGIMLLIRLLKSSIAGGLFAKVNPFIQRAIIVILGVAAGILLQIASGMKWYVALVAGLFTSGGAIAIYEVLKPLWTKPAPAAPVPPTTA